MKRYIFFTYTDIEGVKKHSIKAETCKKAYELLKESGYDSKEITIAGFKGE